MVAVTEPRVPAWAVPAARAVTDLRVIAGAGARGGQTRALGCVDALDWIASRPSMTYDAAGERFATATAARADPRSDGESCTLAWLMGLTTTPPLALPRRNPDGSLVTADQLYAERAREALIGWAPEERRAQRAAAERDAGRWARLAALR